MDVHRVGGIHLHAERHLVLRYACDSLRVSEGLIGPLIDLINRVEHTAAKRTADARRIIQVEHRLTMRSALHALVDTGQKAGTPQLFAPVWGFASGKQDDESR